MLAAAPAGLRQLTLAEDAEAGEEAAVARLWDGSSCSSSETEEQPGQRRATRQIEPNTSVYDDAFLAPLIKPRETCGPWLLLILNFLLQAMVVYKISGYVEDSFADVQQALFGKSNGLCLYSSASLIPSFNMVGGSEPVPGQKYLNCVPDEVFMMYNWSYLDLDGDGNWTQAEAQTLTERLNRPQVSLASTHQRILTSISDSAEMVLGQGRYREDEDARTQATTVLQLLNTSEPLIPRTVFEGQVRPFMDMCIIMDDKLCGNILFRRSFNRTVFLQLFERSGFRGAPLAFLERNPHSGGTVHDVLRMCQITVREICPSFFTVQYGKWGQQRKETCGQPDTEAKILPDSQMLTTWDKLNKQVLTVKFSMVAGYRDVQLTHMYQMFLLLIIVLYTMAMLVELRSLIHWHRVLLGTPAKVKVYEAADEGECDVIMSEISPGFRMLQVCVNLFPRSLIFVFIMWYGTRYLILSNSYSDLILNSLALTFLITIDEMVFEAFVPVQRKSWISNSGPWEAKPQPCIDRLLDCPAQEFFFTFLVIGYVCTVVYWEYTRKDGKDELGKAFQCVCQAAGEGCMAAQVVGGYPAIDRTPNHQ